MNRIHPARLTLLSSLLLASLLLGCGDDSNNNDTNTDNNSNDTTIGDGTSNNPNDPPPTPSTGEPAPSGNFVATPFTPLRTINVNNVNSLNNALSNAIPGDDIVLEDGTYTATNSGADPFVEHNRFAGAFYPRTSGTVTNPIRIRAQNAGEAHLTIAENPGNDGPILSIGNKEYIIISDIVIDAEQSAIRQDTGFLAITGSNHIYIENVIINGTAPAEPFVNNHAAVYLQNVTESRLANNLIQDVSNSSGSHRGEGILMYGVNRSVFEFNSSLNIAGQGIYLKGDREGFNGENNFGNTIRYNYAMNCAAGIQVTGNGQYTTSPRTLIYQNLSDNCERGIYIHGWTSYTDTFNNTAVNNNAADGNEYTGGIVIAGVVTGENHNNRIWGNLVYGVTAQFPAWERCLDYWTANTNYVSDHNLCSTTLRQKQNDTEYTSLAAAKAEGYEINTQETDDPFVNYTDGNYRLHDVNYTHGAFVPDNAGIYNNPVVPGAYITGTEQIGRL